MSKKEMKRVEIFVILSIFSGVLGQNGLPTVPTAAPTTSTTTTTEEPTTTTTTQEVTTTLSATTSRSTTLRPPTPSIPTAPIGTPTTSAPSTISASSTTLTSFECPPTGVHHFPTSHCQHFVICVNGNPYDGQCQNGFLFDEIRRNCEPSEIVDCGNRIRP